MSSYFEENYLECCFFVFIFEKKWALWTCLTRYFGSSWGRCQSISLAQEGADICRLSKRASRLLTNRQTPAGLVFGLRCVYVSVCRFLTHGDSVNWARPRAPEHRSDRQKRFFKTVQYGQKFVGLTCGRLVRSLHLEVCRNILCARYWNWFKLSTDLNEFEIWNNGFEGGNGLTNPTEVQIAGEVGMTLGQFTAKYVAP